VSASASPTNLLQQASFVLDSCGRVVPQQQNYVDIPSHIVYSRLMPGGGSGSTDITGIITKLAVPFYVRAVTAQAFPRASQGAFWRIRYPNGKYFQSQNSPHPMSFGFGSDRQSLLPELSWQPGEKIFVDLDTIIAGPPPSQGYSVSIMFEGVYRFPIPGPAKVSNPLNQNMPRYFIGETQNILAPEFRFAPGCPSETPVGYQDEGGWWYGGDFACLSNLPTSGQQVSNTKIQIANDADFIVREIWPYFPVGLTNQGAGTVVIRLRRDDGYALMSNFLPILSIQGPVFKELKVKAGGCLYYDAYLTNPSGSPGSVVTFSPIFAGVKRKPIT
jgi:hypothetical protein